jgi:hypothetical protein
LDLEALTAKIAEHTKTLETLTGSENKKARAKHYKQLGSLNERLAHLNGSGPAPASASSATKKPKKKQLSQRQKEQERKNLGLPGKDFSKKKAGSGIPGVRSTQGGGGPTLTPYDLKLYLNEATTPAEILAIVEKYSGTSTPNTASQVLQLPLLQQLQLLLLCSSLTPRVASRERRPCTRWPSSPASRREARACTCQGGARCSCRWSTTAPAS